MAALVTEESLHGTRAFWAFDTLGNFPGSSRDIKAAARAINDRNSAIILFKSNFKALVPNALLPFVKVLQDPQDYRAMSSGHHR